jgi:hypothetical protein
MEVVVSRAVLQEINKIGISNTAINQGLLVEKAEGEPRSLLSRVLLNQVPALHPGHRRSRRVHPETIRGREIEVAQADL